MTSTTEAEGNEDVNDFLLRIRELGEKRDKEDEERTKKLEEEILQGRKERQARRAERARSISPTKDSPPILESVRMSMPPLSHRTIEPPEQLEPTPRTPVRDNIPSPVRDETVRSSTESSPARSRVDGGDPGSSPKASAPSLRSRAGTLSWQQRPTSRDLGGNRSFFSTSPTREGRWRATSNASTDDHRVLRSPIPPSSASRESPSPQTERQVAPTHEERPEEESKDAGIDDTSAREPVEEEHGETKKENGHSETVDERSFSPSRASSTFADSSLGYRYSSISSVSTATGLGSPIPLSSAQKFEPPIPDGGSDGQITSPPSPRRLSPERSTSPTKGLGGFVQSAMMKRSDSISKRWSAQLPSGLGRGTSFASNRNSFAAPSNVDIFSTSPISRLSRDGSTLPPNRPTSSHSEATVVHQTKDGERPATPPVSGASETTSRPPLSLHTRSASAISVQQSNDSSPRPTTPPVSRTMDPKRWSPTKSTWLESALNRPESPRHRRQPSQQTSWAKDRQSKSSIDLGRRNSFKEVTPVGLMRTAPPGSHVTKPSISGISDVSTTQDLGATREEIPTTDSTSPTKESSEAEAAEVPPEAPEAAKESSEDLTTRKPVPPSLSPTLKTNVDIPLSSPREPIRDPLLSRPKPQSPVFDFRANLKKREIVKDQSVKEEPEFRNVFGKLRKAEASNYVAPDELKENILRGKAALNATGGPKKSQRVDDLKESILKQKEAMKAGGGSLRRNTVGESDAPATVVPEAILKRNNISKSSSVKSNLSTDSVSSPTAKEPGAPERSHDRQHSLDRSTDERTADPSSQSGIDTQRPDVDDLPKDHLSPEPLVKGTDNDIEHRETELQLEVVDPGERRQEKPIAETIEPVGALPSVDTAQATSSTPPAKEGPVTKGSLAGRINPALAGLLSRGPPAIRGASTTPSVSSSGESTLNSQASTSAPTLAHMTKSRARGPKRRPPKAAAPAAADSGPNDQGESPETALSSFDVDTSETSFSPIEQHPPSGWPLPDQGIISSEGALEPSLAPPNSTVTGMQQTESRKSLPPLPEDATPSPAPSTPSSKPPHLERSIYEDAESREGSPSSKSTFAPLQPATSPSSPQSSRARSSLAHYSTPSPSPLRTSFKENQTGPSPRMAGPRSFFSKSRESSPFRKSLPSPPVPPKGPSASADQLSSPRSSTSLVPQADESLEAISDFFTTFPSSSDRVNIDPQLMLMDKRDNPKIRTLRKQIWEITGDGKKQDLPTNQEYILYEGAMYLCVHMFEEAGNTRSEAHLWCGDDVWEGAVNDALTFSRKIARDNGCKLEVIKQGKEPARFIQALGGILITRRGSSSRSSSSAIFMLCGRKHLGQMVFDEVDYSPSNLCSGYPFVISAMFGKVYLWKGKGSSAEEIGAARLIGMDLGLTGEFEEVAEGEEPSSFYEVFPQHKEASNSTSSSHWSLKPAHDHFRLRLLRVDHELGQRSVFWIRRPGSSSPVIRPNDTVQELEPFCEKDLSPKGIYVLDTFFEIYVIVGEQASNRPAEFASAVVFAHEYGILAASLQDRPFIPKSFISLGGPPESCRSAFRKWSRLPSQRPQVFPLNAAIDAIRS